MSLPRKLLMGLLLLGLVGSARAVTYPGGYALDFTRSFPAGPQPVGVPVPVSASFAMDEDESLGSFYYSEQFPDWIAVGTVQVTVNGSPVAYQYEMGDPGEVAPDVIAHRWVIGDPEQDGELELESGDRLLVEFTLTASMNGTLETGLDGWFGGLEDTRVFGSDYMAPDLMFGSDGVGVPPAAAGGLALDRAYPNPFNPSTRIGFGLDSAGSISLEIVDGRGRLLRRLAAGEYGAGRHEVVWDGRDGAGSALPSGVYFAHLRAGGAARLAEKLVLVK